MRVDDAKTHLSLVQKPGRFRAEASGGTVSMSASPLQVTARCQVQADGSYSTTPADLTRSTNPRFAPWKLGFMQVQILETAWAYYRGAQSDQGCVLNDTSSRRQLTICRDYDRSLGTVWYEGSTSIYDCYGVPDMSRRPPWNLEFYFGDSPLHDVNAHVLNEQTHRYNYLHEALCALAFVTTLTEQITPGIYKHHRHFLWSVNWHVQATSPDPQRQNTAFNLLPPSGFWISEFKRGGPMDSRYLTVLNNPGLTPSCNEIAKSASVDRLVSSDWQRFPLMDQKVKKF